MDNLFYNFNWQSVDKNRFILGSVGQLSNQVSQIIMWYCYHMRILGFGGGRLLARHGGNKLTNSLSRPQTNINFNYNSLKLCICDNLSVILMRDVLHKHFIYS